MYFEPSPSNFNYTFIEFIKIIVFFLLDSTTSQEGYYRGCTTRENACQSIQDNLLNLKVFGTVTNCKLCNDNDCNTSGAKLSIHNSAYALVFAIFVFYFRN